MNDLHVSCNNKEKQINILKIELSVAEDNIKSLKRDINHSKKHNNNYNTGKEKDNSKHLTENIGLKAGIDTLKHQLQIEKNNNKTSTHQLITQLDITKRKLDQCEGDLIQKNSEITSLISLKDDLYQANEKYCNDMIDKENEYMALQQLYQEAHIGSEKFYKLYILIL
jgi:chromosome segregation ATPase